MEFDVARDFGIDSDGVNKKVAAQVRQLRKSYNALRKRMPKDPNDMKQGNMDVLLKNAELIIQKMPTRVDFLSEYGLTKHTELVDSLKDIGKIEYGIGEATAKKIVQLIQYKGEVDWVQYGSVFMTKHRN